MGALRFDITYKKNQVTDEAVRQDAQATFNNRSNDAVFVFFHGHAGDYIRFTLANPGSRTALRRTTRIAESESPASTDAIRVNHDSCVALFLRRQLGLSLLGGEVFGSYKISIVDAGKDPTAGGTYIPLATVPGGDDWVVEC